MGMETSEILFTRQRHEAKRAGLHYDIRLVHGDVAYSWATKKDMPKPGEAIILHQQPIHDSHYALSEKVEIPEGQYGAGVTYLDFVRKAHLHKSEKGDHFTIETKDGEFYLLKQIPAYGGKQWLFKNLTGIHKKAEVSSELADKFKPDVTPEQMKLMGVLEGKYTKGDPVKDNFFKTDASMKEWPEEWYDKTAPLGWYQWYQGYHAGKRTDDDERQIKRWLSFKARHLAQLSKADPTLADLSIQPRRRQALLNWAIAPGLDPHKFEKRALLDKFLCHLEPFDNKILNEMKDHGHTYLDKVAKEEGDRPHTIRALKKLDKQDGLLVDHSMGSGKTRLYLRAIENYQKRNPKDHALIMAPASLTSNVYKEIKKHGINIDTSRLETLSYEKATIDADKLKKKAYGIVVADEAHKLRNSGTKRHQELSEVIVKAKKRLLGTGTSAYNQPSDIAPLVNLAAGERVLPEGKSDFEKRYIEKVVEQPPLLKRILGHPAKEIHKLRNKKELGKILRKHIDHYDLRDDPEAAGKFPKKIETVKEVEMGPEQHALYKYMEGRLPFHLRLKVRMNTPLDKKEVAALQAFSTGVRQVSNSVRSFMPNYQETTPKIRAAVDSLQEGFVKNKDYRALVYSNYLGSGLEDYSRELKNRGIPHAVYHGGLSKAQKDELLDQYNSGKIPVLLLSSSGAEGLNTKGTRKVQILEPHYNKSKIDQVVARAVRYESHEHLPPRDRTVDVEHYLSVLPQSKWHIGPRYHSIDQYLHHNSKTKHVINEEMKELVKEASLMVKCEDILTCMTKEAFFDRPHHDYVRAKYKESKDWSNIDNPVGSVKWDGAAFFMEVMPDGSPRFLSRRESVKGGFPDRTANLVHLKDIKIPQYAGDVYHVELVHTGHEFHDDIPDSHPVASGILNSKPARAQETQAQIGPVRAILLDVIKPVLPTYSDKLEYLKGVKQACKDVPNLHMPNIKIGKDEISELVQRTKKQGQEGVIITSLSAPEEQNVRVKVKHVDTYNLQITGIIQEIDKFGNPKESMGALEVSDATGRVVAKVGTGFLRSLRKEIWENKEEWMGRLIQVKAMPTTSSRLRAPVYNGLADGDLDTVNEKLTSV